MLGLLDRERDRELDRNMVDREMAKRRDDRLLSLLDRERERDRGGADVLNLLERELDRRRDLKFGGKEDKATTKRLRAKDEKEESDAGGGLRAEVRALRNDFKKLLKKKDPVASRGETEARKKGDRGRSGGTKASWSSGRPRRPSTVVEVQFGGSGGAGGGNNSTVSDGDENENEDDASSTRRPGLTGQEIRRRGQSLGIRLSDGDDEDGDDESGSNSN